MIPRDSNPEETRPGAGRGDSPTGPGPLGLVDIPAELVVSIKAYDPVDRSMVAPGFPALRDFVWGRGPAPSRESFDAWLERQERLFEVAVELEGRLVELVNAELTEGRFPHWWGEAWWPALKNRWAEELGVAVATATTILS